MKLIVATLITLSIALGTSAQTTPAAPARLTLVWEAESLVPAGFAGRALPAPGGVVRVAALLHDAAGRPVEPPAAVRWEKDGRSITSAGGVNQSLLRYIAGAAGESNTIRASVGEQSAQLVVPVGTPRVVVYEDEPLAGVRLERALAANTAVRQRELAVRAEPYYFSTAGRAALQFEWRVNNNVLTVAPAEAQEITFTAATGGRSENQINVTVRNLQNIIETATRSFTLTTGGQSFL